MKTKVIAVICGLLLTFGPACMLRSPKLKILPPRRMVDPEGIDNPTEAMFERQKKIIEELQLPAMWKIQSEALGVIVAIIDTGVDLCHPALQGSLMKNKAEIPGNGIDDDHNGYIDDYHGWNTIDDTPDPQDDEGHGTKVAGTIAASGDQSRDVIGIVKKTNIMPVKFLNQNGWGYYEDAVKAITYCIVRKRQTGMEMVINASWCGAEPFPPLEAAIKRAVREGIVFVAAAGNNYGRPPRYPAAYEAGNISVAATDEDELARFSNFDPQRVHVAAPGVNLLSTTLGGKYCSFTGTSAATPIVSGVAALLLQYMSDNHLKKKCIKDVLSHAKICLPALDQKVMSSGKLNATFALEEAKR